jgi:hypothetical protein
MGWSLRQCTVRTYSISLVIFFFSLCTKWQGGLVFHADRGASARGFRSAQIRYMTEVHSLFHPGLLFIIWEAIEMLLLWGFRSAQIRYMAEVHSLFYPGLLSIIWEAIEMLFLWGFRSAHGRFMAEVISLLHLGLFIMTIWEATEMLIFWGFTVDQHKPDTWLRWILYSSRAFLRGNGNCTFLGI